MGDFFKPWRRKLGLVTLLMGCAVMAVWLRNLDGYSEHIIRKAGEPRFVIRQERRRFVIASTSHKFILCYVRNESRYDIVGPFYESSPINPFISRPTIDLGTVYATNLPIEWEYEFCGFELAKRDNMGRFGFLPIELTIVAIPYWSLVIPLAMLSACLLLGKPRSSTAMKITEPIRADGA